MEFLGLLAGVPYKELLGLAPGLGLSPSPPPGFLFCLSATPFVILVTMSAAAVSGGGSGVGTGNPLLLLLADAAAFAFNLEGGGWIVGVVVVDRCSSLKEIERREMQHRYTCVIVCTCSNVLLIGEKPDRHFGRRNKLLTGGRALAVLCDEKTQLSL